MFWRKREKLKKIVLEVYFGLFALAVIAFLVYSFKNNVSGRAFLTKLVDLGIFDFTNTIILIAAFVIYILIGILIFRIKEE